MTIIAMGTRTASASLVTRGSRGNIKVISPKITAAAIDHACMEHHDGNSSAVDYFRVTIGISTPNITRETT
jgi:hypothetical protein